MNEDESDDEELPVVRVSAQEARRCLEKVRLYFMQEGNEDAPAAALDLCTDFVQRKALQTLRQTKLNW